MSFVPSFSINQIVTNQELSTEFKCGNMGGMRRATQTNTLVIISDNTKGLYEDKWQGDVLHYTGMGKSGDQDINFMQNRTLAESKQNGVGIHLFEVFHRNQYVYRGTVELTGTPYTGFQKGEDGIQRLVWIFPVELKSPSQAVSLRDVEALFVEKSRQARRLSDVELRQRALDSQSTAASVRSTVCPMYVRNPYIAEYAKRTAKGICQLCKNEAPFVDINGAPFLETHHIIWLASGGSDSIENTIALCPNCHRRMHVLDSADDIRILLISNQTTQNENETN